MAKRRGTGLAIAGVLGGVAAVALTFGIVRTFQGPAALRPEVRYDASTPAPILARLAQETAAFLRSTETQERYRQQFLEMPQQTDPEAFRAFMLRELATFQDLARAQSIVVE